MEIEEFLMYKSAMCESNANCDVCKLGDLGNCNNLRGLSDAKRVVSVVSEYAYNHPLKTRKDMLLKIFPNVPVLENGGLRVCPRTLDPSHICYNGDCDKCRKSYWDSFA